MDAEGVIQWERPRTGQRNRHRRGNISDWQFCPTFGRPDRVASTDVERRYVQGDEGGSWYQGMHEAQCGERLTSELRESCGRSPELCRPITDGCELAARAV
jgi:hypothetical protein